MDPNSLDIGKLQQLAAMMQQSSLPPPAPTKQEPESRGPLDPEFLRILRSLLPFLDFSFQRHLGIMLKLMELQYTMDFYQHMPEPDEESPDIQPVQILQSIRGACDPNNRSFIDMMLNAMKVQEMMRATQAPKNTPPDTPGSEGNLDARLKDGLTPEQQGMFDMLSSMLST